jgi:hypothetical protein
MRRQAGRKKIVSENFYYRASGKGRPPVPALNESLNGLLQKWICQCVDAMDLPELESLRNFIRHDVCNTKAQTRSE